MDLPEVRDVQPTERVGHHIPDLPPHKTEPTGVIPDLPPQKTESAVRDMMLHPAAAFSIPDLRKVHKWSVHKRSFLPRDILPSSGPPNVILSKLLVNERFRALVASSLGRRILMHTYIRDR